MFLQAIGLPPSAVQGFVLENDPVPRALLAADPAFAALKKSAAGDALLRMRQWLLGPGVPLTPTRFLADTVGDLHLVRWSADAGHTVRTFVHHEFFFPPEHRQILGNL